MPLLQCNVWRNVSRCFCFLIFVLFSQLVKNCCLDPMVFIDAFVLLRIQKFKTTLPNKASCIRLLIYIASVTGYRLDNKSLWEQKTEGQIINDNFQKSELSVLNPRLLYKHDFMSSTVYMFIFIK